MLILTAFLLAPRESARPTSFVMSDSTVRAEAIGFCAVSRSSGTLQGIIVGVEGARPDAAPRYRVQRLENPAAEYLHPPGAVVVVRCENYTQPSQRRVGP